jgi:hypothetical protein
MALPDRRELPSPHPGIVPVGLPQEWPRDHKMRRVIAALRGLAGQSLRDVLVIVEPSQVLVRR